jgi:hypothetical protein
LIEITSPFAGELEFDETNTFVRYPGVASSVFAFASADTEYFGEMKLVCCPFAIS